MKTETNPLKELVPDSVLPYPSKSKDRAKYFFWRMVRPRPYGKIRNGLLATKVIRHHGRQHYLIGRLDPNKIEKFLKYIATQGFGYHFVAWEDSDEVIGMRRLDGFYHQYHIRIFADGEVRGHYEYTPEAHCIKHLKKVGQQERRKDFAKFLGDWVTYS
jgi:hypothetical protein